MEVRQRRKPMAEINVVPLVDVILVVLIIFMVTAPVIQSGIEVSVPQTQLVREITEDRLVVTIDAQQKVYLQNAPVPVAELGDRIREKLLDPTRQSVYLMADKSVPWGTLVVVMDRLKLSGIENISAVTQPLQETKR